VNMIDTEKYHPARHSDNIYMECCLMYKKILYANIIIIEVLHMI